QAEPAPLAQSTEKIDQIEPDKPLAPDEGNGDTPAPLPQCMTREELLAFVAKHAPIRGVVNKTPDALVLAFEGIKSAQEAQFLNQLEVALEGWDKVTFTIQAGRFVGPQRFIRWNQEGQHYEP
ncbi:MAG: hypothetical protein KDB07_13275, partial [Planctomycetes bacterium]|nr:hypothetical protein [Planctomycetota bacterium]